MPIRTANNGVLALSMAAFAVLVSLTVLAEPVSAAPKTATVSKAVSSSTTKGVRTKTAYQPIRRPAVSSKKVAVKKPKTTKKAYAASTTVSIPAEVPPSTDTSGVVARAVSVIGSRYRWGGTSVSTGFDCSGLIKYALGERAGALPRTSAAMYSSVKKTGDLQPGDLVFFGRGKVRHAALYVGNGQVVHASTPRSGVRVDSVHTLAKALGYMGSGRI
ncbi:MAG TPA: NlpC/P60 family protein [Patescibacteria group bacterium]